MMKTVSFVSMTPSCSQCSTGSCLSGPSPVSVVLWTHGSTTSAAKQSVELVVWSAHQGMLLESPLPTRQLLTLPPQLLLLLRGQQSAAPTATF